MTLNLRPSPRPDRAAFWRTASTFAVAALAALAALADPANAATGLTTLPAAAPDHPVTVFYPTASAAQPPRAGGMPIEVAPDAAPAVGNGRLVVISHGSGGSAWVHANLARTLVEAGFVVAVPRHRGDSHGDDSTPGPESWKLRPLEVSRAIDAVGRDPRFAPMLALDRVGVYGMSAGGHTALSMAGGRWSPGNFVRHCKAHIAEDFNACVGLITHQTGGLFDGLKRTIALGVIRQRFSDDTPQEHVDTRVAAVVAAVPFAADFDMASLATPRVPLGLVEARRDAWLTPKFHVESVLAACAACERIADLPTAGHGALLSPLPPGLTGLVGELLNDPPGFDRSVLPEVDRRIAAFFVSHLPPAGPGTFAAASRP
jgi:predicted dienelactone hydrolase